MPVTEAHPDAADRSARRFSCVGAGRRRPWSRWSASGLPPDQQPAAEIERGRRAVRRRRSRPPAAPSDLEEIAALADAMNRMAAELDRAVPDHRAPAERAGGRALEHGGRRAGRRQRGHGDQRSTRPAPSLLGVDAGKAQRPDGARGDPQARPAGVRRGVAHRRVVDGGRHRDRRRDDPLLHAHGTALRDAEDRHIGALVVLHDVTRLRRLENIRRDFVANVSHELRTPITSIKGFVETLLDGAMDDPENAQRFLEIVLRQTDRLNAIIDDLLALSRIEKEAEKRRDRAGPRPMDEMLLRGGRDVPEEGRRERDRGSSWRATTTSRPDQRPAAGAGGGQPGRQRRQVQRAGRDGPRRGRADGRRGRDPRARPGLRHRAAAPAAALRAVLPRRQGPQPQAGRHRAWGWPSSSTSPRPTAARSRSRARSAKAAPSRSACPAAGAES